ncbi:MAG TPA: hypothetical protein VGW38_00870, partial [Chloroflexota bacterium]|nr:hypothetical protein [Chloroflexota bacterium]
GEGGATSTPTRRVGHVSDGQDTGTPSHPGVPGGERGNEPSEAYRQDLPRHDDATYTNLGTMRGSPLGAGQLAAIPAHGAEPP